MSGPRAASRRSRRARGEASLRQWAVADANKWRQTLARHGCKSVFHMTPLGNLESILVHGLLPRAHLRERGIAVDAHSPSHVPHAAARFEIYSVFSLVQFHWRLANSSDKPYIGLVLPSEAVLIRGTRFTLNKIELDSPDNGHPHAVFDTLWTHANSKYLAGEVEARIPGDIRPELIREVRVPTPLVPAVRAIVERARPASSGTPRIVAVESWIS
jgi:hypothetical protein